MSKLVNIKRELNPEQALLKVKKVIKKNNLDLVFCRDYGDSYLLFVKSPGENKKSIAKNAKVVNKVTGRVTDWKDSNLDEKPWTANYNWGDRIWGTTR